MPEKEMNSYRLTSMEEPTDQMLATLMKEVVEEAKKEVGLLLGVMVLHGEYINLYPVIVYRVNEMMF